MGKRETKALEQSQTDGIKGILAITIIIHVEVHRLWYYTIISKIRMLYN